MRNHRRTALPASVSPNPVQKSQPTGPVYIVPRIETIARWSCFVIHDRYTQIVKRRDTYRGVSPWNVSLRPFLLLMRGLFSEGVNVAARLQELADPGGICVSAKVSKEVERKLAFGFEPMGERRMKNIIEPVVCYRVNLQGSISNHAEMIRSSESPMPHRAAIAVLPFINMSGDSEQEYFSDGITEDIITDLSKISGLHVVARNTVFTYKNKLSNVQQTARELGVSYVLEGSVRKAGSRIRVTGQLIDGKTGNHVWADRYDRELTDIFAIQDELTHAIVDQLKVKLLPSEDKALRAAPTENVEAYTYFLRGRQFLHMWSKSNMVLARRMFAQAAELDPNYARAYAGIADCDSMLQLWLPANTLVDGILTMSARALELDPNLADAHASRGVALQFSGRKAEAVAAFERAIALDPDLYEANYYYARYFYGQGEFEKAAKLFERSSQIRPDDYHSPGLLTMAYQALGLTEDVKRAAKLAVERAERELKLHPENSGAAGLGAIALARLGDIKRAKDWAARARALDPDDPPLLYNVACVYSQIGELDSAIDILEKLLPQRGPEQLQWFKNDTDLDAIRSHPRYGKLLETIKPE